MADDFKAKYGPCALIAGAAVGLGAEYARQVAAHGIDLVLIDVNPDPLQRIAKEIADKQRVSVTPVNVDLARPDLLSELGPVLREREIGLLIYNAAIGTVAPFLDLSPEHVDRMLDVNCRAPLRLVHALAPAMVARGRGGIVLMSSMSGNFGSAQLAVYAASKAFALVAADALWSELRPAGVDVLGVQPGSTRTPGWLSSQPDEGETMPAMEPAEVVREALAALGDGPNVITGELNRQGAAVLAAMPRRQAIEMMSGITSQLRRNDRAW